MPALRAPSPHAGAPPVTGAPADPSPCPRVLTSSALFSVADVALYGGGQARE